MKIQDKSKLESAVEDVKMTKSNQGGGRKKLKTFFFLFKPRRRRRRIKYNILIW